VFEKFSSQQSYVLILICLKSQYQGQQCWNIYVRK